MGTKTHRLKQQFKANTFEDMIVPGFMLEIVKMPHHKGCWMWRGSLSKSTGYGKFSFLHGTYLAHRVSWMLFRGLIPEGLFILHKCDNPPCVNPDHLFLGTHAENMRDMLEKGRGNRKITTGSFAFGEEHRMSLLSNEQVSFIRTSDKSYVELAKILGVSAQVVGDAGRGRTYTKVRAKCRPRCVYTKRN